MPKWRRDSEFGAGRRVPLCREQRAQFRAKLLLHRRPGRLTLTCVEIGRILANMLGQDGRLDPSISHLAALARVHQATVVRALARLRACGFLGWVRRLQRRGWRCEQTSNAYALSVPACDTHFAPAVKSLQKKKEAQQQRAGGESDRQSAARQLVALGFPVPAGWSLRARGEVFDG